MRTHLVTLLLFAAASPLFAQSGTDSLLTVGFRSLDRYAESHDLADARGAHRAFSEVLRKSDKNAQAHLGIGLAYAAVEGQQLDPLTVNDATRVTNNTLAVRHLVTALKLGADPDRAANAFVTVVRREYDTGRMRDAVSALMSAKLQSESVHSVLGELYISLYEPERAEHVNAEARTEAGERVLGIAQLLQPAKVSSGGAHYLAALARSDSASMREFVRDARWLADPGEAALWKTLPLDSLRGRLRQFWERRALKAGISVSERLATHFTRVQHALQEFSYYRQRIAPKNPLAIDPTIDGRDYDVDDRAFTYVRYGEPDQRISTIDTVPTPMQTKKRCVPSRRLGQASNCTELDPMRGTVAYPSNETWVYYNLGDHPTWFDYWLPPGDARGWTLVADVVRCAPGTYLPYSEQWLRDRMQVDPRFGVLLAECHADAGHVPDQSRVQFIALPLVKQQEAYLAKAVVRDDGVPRTKKNLSLAADVLQFAGENGATDVTAVVVFPLSEFAAPSGIASARLSLMIADTLKGSTIARDTTVTVRVPPTPGARARVYLRTTVPPGAGTIYRVSVRDLNAANTVTIVGDTIDIRPLSSARLMLSDVALIGGEGGSWERAGRRLSLLPRGTPTREFGVYYEVYNMAPGTKYQTTMSLDPADEGLAAIVQKLKGTRVVSFSFEGSNESRESTVRELRQVKSELPAGKYHLVLKVSSNVGSAQIERFIVLPK